MMLKYLFMASMCDYEMYVWSYCDDVLAAIAVPTHAAISLANFLFNFCCLILYVCMYVLYDHNTKKYMPASAMYVLRTRNTLVEKEVENKL
jgi:hypothetical protein